MVIQILCSYVKRGRGLETRSTEGWDGGFEERVRGSGKEGESREGDIERVETGVGDGKGGGGCD